MLSSLFHIKLRSFSFRIHRNNYIEKYSSNFIINFIIIRRTLQRTFVLPHLCLCTVTTDTQFLNHKGG